MALPEIEVIDKRMFRTEDKLDQHTDMIHALDKKVDVMTIEVVRNTNVVSALRKEIGAHNSKMIQNSEAGKKRHSKSAALNVVNTAIIFLSVAGLVVAGETELIKPLLKILTGLGG